MLHRTCIPLNRANASAPKLLSIRPRSLSNAAAVVRLAEPYRIKTDGLKFIGPEFHAELKKFALRPGDVVIVRTGKPGACDP